MVQRTVVVVVVAEHHGKGTAGNHAGVGTHKGDWPGEYIDARAFG